MAPLRGARLSLLSWATLAALVGVWTVLTGLDLVSADRLPSPASLARHFESLWTTGYTGKPLATHVWASVKRTLVGLGSGIGLGVPVGLIVGYSPRVSAVLSPIFGLLRPVPPIALIPMVILYFGIGEFSRVLLIFIAAFNYMALNTAGGIRGVPQDLLRVGMNLGLSRWELFAKVMLPAAMPQILVGVKVAAAVSWAIVVAAELVAAQEGLGYIILDAATFFRIPEMYVGIIIIGVIGFLLEILINQVERRLLHWQGK